MGIIYFTLCYLYYSQNYYTLLYVTYHLSSNIYLLLKFYIKYLSRNIVSCHYTIIHATSQQTKLQHHHNNNGEHNGQQKIHGTAEQTINFCFEIEASKRGTLAVSIYMYTPTIHINANLNGPKIIAMWQVPPNIYHFIATRMSQLARFWHVSILSVCISTLKICII